MLRLKPLLKYFVPFEIMFVYKHEIECNDVLAGISLIETIPPRQIRRVAAIKTDLVPQLNDIDDDIDE